MTFEIDKISMPLRSIILNEQEKSWICQLVEREMLGDLEIQVNTLHGLISQTKLTVPAEI